VTAGTNRWLWCLAGHEVAIPFDVLGSGDRNALLLPALSSISTRAEMYPLAKRLAARFRCFIPDWPGFGAGPRADVALGPDTMRGFLEQFIDDGLSQTGAMVGVGAGHSATYLVEAARRRPDRFSHLVLVAPTWRGPLPTVMGEERRPLFDVLRRTIEVPFLGELVYRLNVSRPIVARMLRAHVYADPAYIDDQVLAAKLVVTRQKRARFGTAAFVTGGLDPVHSRAGFLALFDASAGLPPILLVRPTSVPRKSGTEIDELAATGRVKLAAVQGALAAHEEQPDQVAAAIDAFVEHPPTLAQP
jgi:pimeloyl-ACP methyl ester carboxylesterase